MNRQRIRPSRQVSFWFWVAFFTTSAVVMLGPVLAYLLR